jgi:hypothetical protein
VHEAAALVAAADAVLPSHAPGDADELRVIASFVRRPPPELRVSSLEVGEICELVDGIPLAA